MNGAQQAQVLKAELAADLNLARRICARYYAERGRIYGVSRRREAHDIKGIRTLSTELEVDLVVNLKCTSQRQVEAMECRGVDEVDW